MTINWLKSIAYFLKRSKQHLEAKIRKHLPFSLGGRFRPGDTETRVLTENDLAAYFKISEIRVTPEVKKSYVRNFYDTDNPKRFQIGVFWQKKLVAARFCLPMWEFLGIKGQWFGGAIILS